MEMLVLLMQAVYQLIFLYSVKINVRPLQLALNEGDVDVHQLITYSSPLVRIRLETHVYVHIIPWLTSMDSHVLLEQVEKERYFQGLLGMYGSILGETNFLLNYNILNQTQDARIMLITANATDLDDKVELQSTFY